MLIQYFIYGRNKKIEVEKSDILEFGKSDDTYEKVKILGREFKVNKIRAYYALRLSLLIAITAFINERFILPNGIQEGKWMVYSIFSLTELFGENCRIKSKKRIQGTIIGALIVLVLFMFIKSTPLRGLIVLVAGYLNSYFEDYRDTMVCVTVSTVASVALTNGTLLTAIERILFVSIGILISLIGNKLIFSDFKKGEI
ncbi:FUSC family protein [Clostridium butyricum]|nr:FUSC family protein [Clostridium butyricum]